MEFIHIDYDENKKELINSLSEYYAQQCPDIAEHRDLDVNMKNGIYSKPISLAVTQDNKIIGRIIGVVDYITLSARIEDLFVDEVTRGTGLGKELVQEFEKIARKENCQMMFVDTTSSSAPKFYEKQGFMLIGKIKDYPMENEIYYLYMKRLT